MNFTKEPPYSLGELACIVNAMIDVLQLEVPRLTQASIGQINNALIRMDKEYRSSFSLADQWNQTVDILVRMNVDEKTQEKIIRKAEKYYEHLKQEKKLI